MVEVDKVAVQGLAVDVGDVGAMTRRCRGQRACGGGGAAAPSADRIGTRVFQWGFGARRTLACVPRSPHLLFVALRDGSPPTISGLGAPYSGREIGPDMLAIYPHWLFGYTPFYTKNFYSMAY
jgi:hypothetical protein